MICLKSIFGVYTEPEVFQEHIYCIINRKICIYNLFCVAGCPGWNLPPRVTSRDNQVEMGLEALFTESSIVLKNLKVLI